MTSGSKQDSPVFPRSAGGKWRLLASDTMWGKLRGLDDGKPYTLCSMPKNEPHPWFPQGCGSLLQLLFLSLWCEGCQGEIERLEKGSSRLCNGVVYCLGSLALGNRRRNRAQWPFSRWLGDDVCYCVSHLLGIGGVADRFSA